ncbi:MAG: hypothetical protein AAGI24_02520 [Pseudomonadota bacterium]
MKPLTADPSAAALPAANASPSSSVAVIRGAGQGSPWINMTALILVLAGISLANATLVIQNALVTPPAPVYTSISMTLGTLGLILIWYGLKAGDVLGSMLGYMGGTLVWVGFFEWTWWSCSHWLGIETLVIDGRAVLPPSMLLVQASSMIFLPLLLLAGTNKDTRCRMMLWCRRRLGLHIPRDAGHQHHAARVSATETVFIIWFVYLLNITLYDPRLVGPGPGAHHVVSVLIGVWALYLCTKLIRIAQIGAAIRYAIPTAYFLSIPLDSMTLAGWFPAMWVQPLSYPGYAAGAVLAFVAAALLLYRADAEETAGA